jgi:hypothetical protein
VRDLVSIVAQQINLLAPVGSYGDRAQQSFQRYQTLQEGLSTLSQAPLDPVLFERAWVEYLATLLECPLAALFSWTPESGCATVAAAASLTRALPFPQTWLSLLPATLYSRSPSDS